jgi:hypothetical protein
MNDQPRQASKIMIIRHAEKPTSSPPPHGVTLKGERETESLIVRGWQRAGALVSLFAPTNKSFQNPSLAEPQFLYASTPTKRNGSRRPLETITPLAEKLAIRINSNFPKLEAIEMVKEAYLCDGVGNNTTPPQEWSEDRFDMVWVFDKDEATGQYGFKQVPQNLLMGDWATPIR